MTAVCEDWSCAAVFECGRVHNEAATEKVGCSTAVVLLCCPLLPPQLPVVLSCLAVTVTTRRVDSYHCHTTQQISLSSVQSPSQACRKPPHLRCLRLRLSPTVVVVAPAAVHAVTSAHSAVSSPAQASPAHRISSPGPSHSVALPPGTCHSTNTHSRPPHSWQGSELTVIGCSHVVRCCVV